MSHDKRTEKKLFKATIIFILRNGKVLMALKTRHIGEGCIMPYGGGVEKGETGRQCALRETEEECGGITGTDDNLKQVGFVRFKNTPKKGPKFTCECSVYTLYDSEGEPSDTETMINPEWFDPKALPFARMMPGDSFWVSQMLNKKGLFLVTVPYGPHQESLTGKVKVKKVKRLPIFADGTE